MPEVLRAAATYGYDGVELRVISRELDLWNLPEFKSSSLATTRTVIQDHGLVIASMGSSACFHSPDVQERERNLDVCAPHGRDCCRARRALHSSLRRSHSTGCDRKQTAAWIADSLTQLADKLKPAGVQVWLETHGDFASAADVSEIFAQLDCAQVGIIWDPANAFEQNGEAPLILPQMSSCIRHVHLKDL